MSVNNREIMLCEKIEKQARLIADLKFQNQELEARLSDCIEPKFKIGQEVWFVYSSIQKMPFKFKIGDISYYSYKTNKFLYDSEEADYGVAECYLFATEEEAKAKLEELKNGIKS